MIQALFRYFDTDHSGVISSQDLRSAFRKTGKLLASTEVKNIMRLYAPTEGQGITLEKFKRALQPVRIDSLKCRTMTLRLKTKTIRLSMAMIIVMSDSLPTKSDSEQ